jgi:hypothetical protein
MARETVALPKLCSQSHLPKEKISRKIKKINQSSSVANRKKIGRTRVKTQSERIWGFAES